MKNYSNMQFKSFKEFKAFLSEVKFMPTQTNRSLSRNHTEKLKQKIKQYGMLSTITLLQTNVFEDDSKYYILDGQHRVLAILDIDDEETINGFFGINIIGCDNLEEIVKTVSSLNSASQNWTLLNYLKAWITLDKKPYLTLESIWTKNKNEYKISLSSLLEAYTGVMGKTDSFKNGNLKLDMELGNGIFDTYKKCIAKGLPICAGAFSSITRIMIQHRNVVSSQDIVNVVSSKEWYRQIMTRESYKMLFYQDLKLNKPKLKK